MNETFCLSEKECVIPSSESCIVLRWLCFQNHTTISFSLIYNLPGSHVSPLIYDKRESVTVNNSMQSTKVVKKKDTNKRLKLQLGSDMPHPTNVHKSRDLKLHPWAAIMISAMSSEFRVSHRLIVVVECCNSVWEWIRNRSPPCVFYHFEPAVQVCSVSTQPRFSESLLQCIVGLLFLFFLLLMVSRQSLQ